MQYKLYIMQAGNFIKIGITARAIKSRASEIQTGCPLAITDIFYIVLADKASMHNTELKLHKKFKKYHTYGEWFTKFYRFIGYIAEEINKSPADFIHVGFNNQNIIGESKSEKGEERVNKRDEKSKKDKEKSKQTVDVNVKNKKEKLAKWRKNNPHILNA